MEFASSSSRFSKEEDEEEEREPEEEEEEDEEPSPREIPFMTAAAAASGTGGGTASSSSSPPAAASASASGSAALRSSDGAGASGSGAGGDDVEVIEKEHMFDKVVTPSDVGKLNRLVIPKQYAEKYFPLDAAGSEKGLLLGFEDTAGKQWRFRYSYWNSSQSYVMTKGWSRFVKEKRLVAGDTVSFSRAVADDAPRRLFIDWKRRVDSRGPLRFSGLALPMPLASHHFGGPHHYSPWGFGAGAGGGGGFFLPPPPPATLYEHHRFRQGLDFRGMTYPAPTVGRQLLFFGSARSSMPPHAPLRPPHAPAMPLHYTLQPSSAGVAAAASRPVVLDSVPVIESPTTAAKRVRLFGVNLDNNSSQSDGAEASHQGNALSLQMPGWQQRSAPTLRLLELPRHGAESSAASSPSSSSSSKREARSALDLDL